MTTDLREIIDDARECETNWNIGLPHDTIDELNRKLHARRLATEPIICARDKGMRLIRQVEGRDVVGRMLISNVVVGEINKFVGLRNPQPKGSPSQTHIGIIVNSFTSAQSYWCPLRNASVEHLGEHIFDDDVVCLLIDELIQDEPHLDVLSILVQNLPYNDMLDIKKIEGLMNYRQKVYDIFQRFFDTFVELQCEDEPPFYGTKRHLHAETIDIHPSDEWAITVAQNGLQLGVRRRTEIDAPDALYIPISPHTPFEFRYNLAMF